MNSFQLVNAFEFASHKHKHQKRKGKHKFPYFSHIAAVATLLAYYGYEEEVIIAGILHDTLEDTDTTYDELAFNFGKQVADLVLDVTENKELPYREMRYSYIEHLKQEETKKEAAAISCCDLIANLNSLLLEEEHTPGVVAETYKFLSKKLTEDYLTSVVAYRRNVIAQRLGDDAPAVLELDKVLKKIHKLANSK